MTMPKKKRERSTSRMPSGAQQYTRGDDSQARLRNIDSLISSRRLDNMLDGVDRDLSSASGEKRALHEAFMDEASRMRAARQNDAQASQDREELLRNRIRNRKFADGGMVRGTRPVQVSGKNFSGKF
jgi:hypothetical protein